MPQGKVYFLLMSSSHRTKVVLKCSRYIWPDLLEEILPALVRKTCWWNGCGQALVPQLFLRYLQDVELLLLAVQRRLVPNNSWLSRTERKMVNLADIRDAFEVSDEEIVPLAPNSTRSWYQLGNIAGSTLFNTSLQLLHGVNI